MDSSKPINMGKRAALLLGGWIVSNLLWLLIAPALGIALGAVLAAVVDIAQPWRSFFFVGVTMLASGLTLAVGRYVVVPFVEPHLPKRMEKAVTLRERAETDRQDRQRLQVEAQERQLRVVLHEAITTLEDQRGMIRDRDRFINRTWQGEWGDNRGQLAEHQRFDKAVRATERAFQSVGRISSDFPQDPAWDEAEQAIDAALVELEAGLEAEA
jgi:hypothetical protein